MKDTVQPVEVLDNIPLMFREIAGKKYIVTQNTTYTHINVVEYDTLLLLTQKSRTKKEKWDRDSLQSKLTGLHTIGYDIKKILAIDYFLIKKNYKN